MIHCFWGKFRPLKIIGGEEGRPAPPPSLKATFHLTISMRGRAKFKGIITITGVAGLL